MTQDRGRCLLLTIAFVALIGAVAPIQIVLERRAGVSPRVLELFGHAPTATNLRRFERDLANACAPAETVRPWVQYIRFLVLKDAGDKAVPGRDGWFFYRPAVQYLVEPWSPEADAGRDNIFSAIISFRDQLSRRGIKLLLVPTPNKASIYPDRLTARAVGIEQPVNPVTRGVLSRLKEAGIEVFDLFELYEQARTGPSSQDSTDLYLAQDSHWSPEGMRLAAAAVARRVLDLGWIEPGPVRYETRPVTVERRGDVLRMIQADPIERLFDPQHMHCTQVVDANTNRLYQDDPSSPILVLGDSFLRIFERDEPGSGGFIAHLACHLGLGLTSIVNDGGASTLVRQQLARKPALLEGKKVVIWEFVERDIRFGTEGWQVIPLR